MPYLADCFLMFIPTGTIPSSLKSYIQGETPLSTWATVISMIVTYLTVVFGMREIIRDRAPLKLTDLFRAHNLFLSVASLVLVLLIGEEVVSNWIKFGSYGILCAEEAYSQRIEFYLLMNYYLKYYEFVDTLFLVLKKKPLTFLHVYHHSSTVLLGFVELNGRATVYWVAVFLNLSVHAIMYYYYFATAGGAKFWWKQYVTILQLIQFVIILVTAFFAIYHVIAHNWYPVLPHFGNCAGKIGDGLIGIAVITSYLVLFVNFFKQTYTKRPQTVRSR